MPDRTVPRIIPPIDRASINTEALGAARNVALFGAFAGVMTGLAIGNAGRLDARGWTAIAIGLAFGLMFLAAAIEGAATAGAHIYRLGYARRGVDAVGPSASRKAAGQ